MGRRQAEGGESGEEKHILSAPNTHKSHQRKEREGKEKKGKKQKQTNKKDQPH
jgi:hypothetical protein